jgi:hypothetical protein
MRKHGNYNAVSTLLNASNRDPCPLRSIIGRGGVTVVADAEEKNTELQMDRELRGVGIVGKDGVVDNKTEEAVKCLRIDTKLATKKFWAMDPPVVEEV